MNNFSYARATSSTQATGLLAATADAKLLGGGTNLVDLMREDIERPQSLIDVSRLPLGQVMEKFRRLDYYRRGGEE